MRKGIVEELEKEGLLSVQIDRVLPISPIVITTVSNTNLQSAIEIHLSILRQDNFTDHKHDFLLLSEKEHSEEGYRLHPS